jgi:hypothetical protein
LDILPVEHTGPGAQDNPAFFIDFVKGRHACPACPAQRWTGSIGGSEQLLEMITLADCNRNMAPHPVLQSQSLRPPGDYHKASWADIGHHPCPANGKVRREDVGRQKSNFRSFVLRIARSGLEQGAFFG